MKKQIIISLISLFVLFNFNAIAQKYKFGHINSSQLLQLMPERENAQKVIQTHAKELEEQLKDMQLELQTKYQNYVAKQDSMSDLIKKTKGEELTNLEQRIQNFQVTAQQNLQQKESELLQPIIEKAQKAIKEIAETNGFIYIFDTSVGSVIYFSKDSEDILPLVKKKLEIAE